MRLPPVALAVGVVALGAVACSDDAEDPPAATGTETEFCTELRTAVTEHVTIFDPIQPTTADATEAATAALAAAAPEEVAEPMRLLADTFAQVTAVLDQFDAADPEAATAIDELGIDQAAISDAQAEVSAYALDSCGVDLAAMNAASVTTTSAPVAPTTTASPTTVPPVASTTAPPTTAPPPAG